MAEALEEPFALEELEISQIEEYASVSNFRRIAPLGRLLLIG